MKNYAKQQNIFVFFSERTHQTLSELRCCQHAKNMFHVFLSVRVLRLEALFSKPNNRQLVQRRNLCKNSSNLKVV